MHVLGFLAFSLKALLYWLLLSRTLNEVPHGLCYTNAEVLKSTLETALITEKTKQLKINKYYKMRSDANTSGILHTPKCLSVTSDRQKKWLKSLQRTDRPCGGSS